MVPKEWCIMQYNINKTTENIGIFKQPGTFKQPKIRRQLNALNLFGKITRKKLIVWKRNRNRRVDFAKKHIN